MNNEYTIVVPNNDVLACVCGTNDSNLKLIEENLGIPVYTKGNEISINNNDSYLCQKFQFIIDRIIDEINDGSKNTEDIVFSVLNTEKKVDMQEVSIREANMELIEKVLRKHGGNRKAAAAELGISERTLYRKLKK